MICLLILKDILLIQILTFDSFFKFFLFIKISKLKETTNIEIKSDNKLKRKGHILQEEK